MHITIVGSGYVGLVSGACFSEFGANVTCVDNDQEKIARLNRGEIPIFEPGLALLVYLREDINALTGPEDTDDGTEVT